MWEYEHSIETTATAEALWARLADVASWKEWNADIEKVEIDGPFTTGSRITMTPHGGEPVQLRLAEVRAHELFIDEAELDGIVVRTTHCLAQLDKADDSGSTTAAATTTATARTRITYRTQITGPAVDEVGPQLGPAITSDLPETMAALARAAGA